MDPVDQAIETYVISPLSDFLAHTSEMDAIHYEYVQKFSNAVGSLFTGPDSFSGPAADTTANLAGDYNHAENRMNNSGVSERLNEIKILCDATIKTLQWDMQAHWIPWIDYHAPQGHGSSPSWAMSFAGLGSIEIGGGVLGDIGIGGGVLGGIEATTLGAALLEALAAVAIVVAAVGEAALKQKKDEVFEAVAALAGLVAAVQTLAWTHEAALPLTPALTAISVSIPTPTAGQSSTAQSIFEKWYGKAKGLKLSDVLTLVCLGYTEAQIDDLLINWNVWQGMLDQKQNKDSLQTLIKLASGWTTDKDGNEVPADESKILGGQRILAAMMYLWTSQDFLTKVSLPNGEAVGPWNIIGISFPRPGANGVIQFNHDRDIDLIIKIKAGHQTLFVEVGGENKGSEGPGRFTKQMDALIQTAGSAGRPCVCLVAPKPGSLSQQPKSFREAYKRAVSGVGEQNVFVVYPNNTDPNVCAAP